METQPDAETQTPQPQPEATAIGHDSEPAGAAPEVSPIPALPTDDAAAPGPEAAPAQRQSDLDLQEGPAADAEVDELGQLAAAASRARLPAADEERLVSLLKAAILGGRGGVARAVQVLPTLPWIVGVRGVEQTWPELTAGFRTQLLSGLAKEDSEGARRIRLSLARALFKLDQPVALKLAVAVLKELRDKESGELSAKNAQIIANVLIGRGRPWVAQLPLAELKPADVDLLVHCAALAVFVVPHPPVTQLGVLKWAHDAGSLANLQEPALAAVVKGLARWNAKWQAALRKEVPSLPPAVEAVLRPAAPAPEEAGVESETSPEPESHREEEKDEEDEDEGPGDDAPVKERPVYEPRPQRPAAEEGEAQRDRPVYTPRHAGGGARAFNLHEALRNIEAHVQSLRNDLAAAQAKARQKDDDRRSKRPEKLGAIIEGEPTPDELARLNLQLESRNQELQARIDELTQHSEDLAASTGAMTGEPVVDGGDQLRTLLGFKLQEDFADFSALEQEGNDLVIQQHYRTIIRHVFEVLKEAKVPL